MSAEDALRYVAHEARRCHDRDAHEALCLLLPAILAELHLPPMDGREALAFHIDLLAAIRARCAAKGEAAWNEP